MKEKGYFQVIATPERTDKKKMKPGSICFYAYIQLPIFGFIKAAIT